MRGTLSPIFWLLSIVLGVLAMCAGNARAFPQDMSSLPKPASVVKPAAYVSLEPVPRGKEFQVAVVVGIARGFHMNSHTPLDPYLIPTAIKPQPPAGVKVLATTYPKGQVEKFPFSPDKPLDVYSGSVTLLLRVSAEPSAHIGEASLPLVLRYQACNDSACLAPVNVPIQVKFEIAAAGAKSRSVHPEIFAASSARH